MSMGRFIWNAMVPLGWLATAAYMYARVDWILLVQLDGFQAWTFLAAGGCILVMVDTFDRYIAVPMGWSDE